MPDFESRHHAELAVLVTVGQRELETVLLDVSRDGVALEELATSVVT